MPVKATFHISPNAFDTFHISRKPSRASASTFVATKKLKMSATVDPSSAEVSWLQEASLVTALVWQSLPDGSQRIKVTGPGPLRSTEVTGWISALGRDGSDNLGPFGGQAAWLPYVSNPVLKTSSPIRAQQGASGSVSDSHFRSVATSGSEHVATQDVIQGMAHMTKAWRQRSVHPELNGRPTLMSADIWSVVEEFKDKIKQLENLIYERKGNLKVRVHSDAIAPAALSTTDCTHMLVATGSSSWESYLPAGT